MNTAITGVLLYDRTIELTFFQMGTVALRVSMAKLMASKLSFLCGDETAITMLASVTGTNLSIYKHVYNV